MTKEKKIKTEKIKTASAYGKNLPISTKQSCAICDYVRGKQIDKAISMLEEVSKSKKPIPMKGEHPHKKGIMSGKYPIKAVKEIIPILKSLKSNAINKELELEKCVLYCKADLASRPYLRWGRGKHKRTNLTVKLIKK